MRKKYYIFVLTFLCLLVGQMGYGQSWLPGIELDEVIINTCDPEHVQYDLCRCDPEWCDSGDPCDYNSSAYNKDECYGVSEDSYDPCDYLSIAYDPCTCDPNSCEEQTPPEEPQEKTWYLDFDGDGYHGAIGDIKLSNKWELTTLGADCDDARPQYTTVCCTKTCESGYELNVDTCECELLPPCFDVNSNTDTSNLFISDKIFESLAEVFSSLGLKSDILSQLDKKFFEPGSLTNTAQKYIDVTDNLGTVGDAIGIVLSVDEFLDEPTSQNLLKVAFDSVMLTVGSGGQIATGLIEAIYKNKDGESLLDIALHFAADKIDRSIDCNLGKGVHGKIFRK